VICLLPFRFSLAETAFVGWVGLRGAVSIFLASVPMLTGMQHAEFFFNVAFAVVIASLVVQGWTVAPVARWLDVTLPRVHHPVSRVELDLPGQLEYEIVGYEVPADGAILQQAAPPAWARLLLIARGERVLAPGEAGALRPGDYAYLLAPPWRAHLLDRLFAPSDEIAESDRDFFGEFVFGGEVRLAVLAALYGLPAPADAADSTIAEFFRERMSEHPVVGDRLPLGGSALIVRELDGDRVTQVGLRLEAPARPHRFAWLRRLLDRRLRREAPGAAPPAAASGASLREDPSESR
jgi:cell volume regulation protein A